MAKTTKAHRPKRRWIGLEVDAAHGDRTSIEAAVRAVLGDGPLLFDAMTAAKRGEPVGCAIVRVNLSEARMIRAVLDDEASWSEHGLRSVTTSGKIRLVRERLNLPRPPRR
jgi:hypothetical protein